ncbi:MAG: hypothetical protein Kow0062_06550 [Acidobacteriota bacterium]
MLDALIDLARGPLLRVALLVLAIGLARALVQQVWEIGWAWRRAGDMYVPWRIVIRRNLAWLLPWRYLRREHRYVYNAISAVFHLGILVVPLFLAGHVALWRREVGLSWPVLPAGLADAMTVAAIVALCGLLVGRAASPAARGISTWQDWLLPVACLLPMLSGLLLAHPEWTFWDARITWLAHLLSAELLMAIAPFSKLSHMVLFWVSQTSTELGWRFPPGFGERVRVSLGKEGLGI